MQPFNSVFPEAPPATVVPHLKGLDDYSYMAVLGRGHFGKVCFVGSYLRLVRFSSAVLLLCYVFTCVDTCTTS